MKNIPSIGLFFASILCLGMNTYSREGNYKFETSLITDLEFNEPSSMSNNSSNSPTKKVTPKKQAWAKDSIEAYSLIKKSKDLPREEDFQKALALIDQADEIFKLNRNELGSAICKLERANIFMVQGEMLKAQGALQESYNKSIEIKDTVLILRTLNALGNLYCKSENYEFSLEKHQQALKLARKVDDRMRMTVSFNNMAIVYLRTNKFDKAKAYYEKVYDYAKNNPKSKFKHLALINLASLSHDKKNYPDAIDFGKRALDAIDEYDQDPLQKTYVYYTLCQVYIALEDFPEAKVNLDKLCTISNEISSIDANINCDACNLTYYKATKDFEKAFYYLERVVNTKDSLFGFGTKSAIDNAKVNLDLEKKEEEITNLQQISQVMSKKVNLIIFFSAILLLFMIGVFLIFRYRQRAKKAILERRITESKLSVMQSQMNPHFIFNAFTAVQNFILKSEKLEAYKYLNKLASLLRRIVSNTENTYINLEQEVEFLNDYLELEQIRFRDNISYELTVDEKLNSVNPLIPSMMIQPHIENAFVHGLSGIEKQGALSIHFEQFDDGLKCTIKDNGIGREASAKIKQKSIRNHLDVASVNSMKRLSFLKDIGYDNAKIAVKDLFEGKEASGTEVVIYLPFINHI